MGTAHFGVDLSAWNELDSAGELYAALKREGGGAEPFAYLNSTDPNLDAKWAALAGAGFGRHLGLYVYELDPTTTSVPTQIRRACARKAHCPVLWDSENTYGRTWAEVRADVRQARDVTVEHRRSYATYCDLWFEEATGGLTRPLWLAEPGVGHPSVTCLVWQRSWTAELPGMGNPTDLDTWMGNDATFRTFFEGFYR